eukprot:2106831-Prorocentrum_lima.AAC.1
MPWTRWIPLVWGQQQQQTQAMERSFTGAARPIVTTFNRSASQLVNQNQMRLKKVMMATPGLNMILDTHYSYFDHRARQWSDVLFETTSTM